MCITPGYVCMHVHACMCVFDVTVMYTPGGSSLFTMISCAAYCSGPLYSCYTHSLLKHPPTDLVPTFS